MGAWSNTVTIVVGQARRPGGEQQGRKPSLAAILALGALAAAFAYLSTRGR